MCRLGPVTFPVGQVGEGPHSGGRSPLHRRRIDKTKEGINSLTMDQYHTSPPPSLNPGFHPPFEEKDGTIYRGRKNPDVTNSLP